MQTQTAGGRAPNLPLPSMVGSKPPRKEREEGNVSGEASFSNTVIHPAIGLLSRTTGPFIC